MTRREGWLLVVDRVPPALLWSWFAAQAASQFDLCWQTHATWLVMGNRATNLLLVTVLLMLFLIRHPRRGARSPVLGRLIALAGTFLPLWISALSWRHTAPGLLTVSLATSWMGMVGMLIALASLGRCFGLFPEVRGLVTTGLYKWIRHPLYLSEAVMVLGVLLPVFSWRAAAAYALWLGMQIWRLYREEDALERVFPEYEAYRQRTWRLLPGVW